MSSLDSAVAQLGGSTDRQEILRTLRAVLESTHFSKSKRYPALLDFAVRTALEDPSAFPKERTVGITVFGRSADYDTSSDPVVRIAAGEVRRRLNLYFSEHPEAPLRIDLPIGSYRAEFHTRAAHDGTISPLHHAEASVEAHAPANVSVLNTFPKAAAETTEASPQELHPHSVPHAPLAHGRRLQAVAAALVLASVAVGAGVWRHFHEAARTDFWSPLLSGGKAAWILVGQKNPDGTTSAAAPAGSVAATPATTTEERPNLVLDDAIVAGQVCSIFREYGSECRISPATAADPKDLDGKPLVLIGGFNNVLTQRVLAGQPYRFEHNTAMDQRDIVERTPNGDVVMGAVGQEPAGALRLRDYAVIGRFRSDITHSDVVVLAGLGVPGTDSAAQFLLSPDKMRALLANAPKGWSGKNVEAVLRIDAVQGTTPEVQVVGSRFW